MSGKKDIVPVNPTLRAQSTGAMPVLSEVTDDALNISKALKEGSTRVENEE